MASSAAAILEVLDNVAARYNDGGSNLPGEEEALATLEFLFADEAKLLDAVIEVRFPCSLVC